MGRRAAEARRRRRRCQRRRRRRGAGVPLWARSARHLHRRRAPRRTRACGDGAFGGRKVSGRASGGHARRGVPGDCRCVRMCMRSFLARARCAPVARRNRGGGHRLGAEPFDP
eukprot:4784991-Prymnesium_polylepis.1